MATTIRLRGDGIVVWVGAGKIQRKGHRSGIGREEWNTKPGDYEDEQKGQGTCVRPSIWSAGGWRVHALERRLRIHFCSLFSDMSALKIMPEVEAYAFIEPRRVAG